MRYLLCILFISTLAGCVSTASKITKDVDTLNDENMGYALIGLQSTNGFSNLLLNGESYVRLNASDINQGSSYLLVPLNAGTYNFYRVEHVFGYYNEFNTDGDYWQFTITPGTVNYVGHLSLAGRFRFGVTEAELLNFSSSALEFMEEKFPTILETRKIVYGGPGEDDFFDFVSQLPDLRDNKTTVQPEETTQGEN